MKPIYIIVFFVLGFALTTCKKTEAEPLNNPNGCRFEMGGGTYEYPQNPSSPEGGLFPRTEPDTTVYGPRSVAIEIPGKPSIVAMIQAVLLAVIGYYLRSQTALMTPK